MEITSETFAHGHAYAAGMVLIYLLVVAQFRSYLVPLVIMAPIPLTVIGVMPGSAAGRSSPPPACRMIAWPASSCATRSVVDFINQETARAYRSPRPPSSLRGPRKAHVLTGLARCSARSSSSTTRSFNGWRCRWCSASSSARAHAGRDPIAVLRSAQEAAGMTTPVLVPCPPAAPSIASRALAWASHPRAASATTVVRGQPLALDERVSRCTSRRGLPVLVDFGRHGAGRAG